MLQLGLWYWGIRSDNVLFADATASSQLEDSYPAPY